MDFRGMVKVAAGAFLLVGALAACGSGDDDGADAPPTWKCAASSDGKYCQCLLGGTPGGIYNTPRAECPSAGQCCTSNQGMEDGMQTGCDCLALSELTALNQTCEQSAASVNDRVVASCPGP